MATKKPRITWRKQKNEGGLASIGQSPRGYELFVNGVQVGSVSAKNIGWKNWSGWYWHARSDELGIEWRNTSSEKPFADIEDAKVACKAYVVECLKSKGLM